MNLRAVSLRRAGLLCGCVLGLCLLSSCSLLKLVFETDSDAVPTSGSTPIQGFQRSKDTIAVEIFRVRVRPEHRELLQALWDDGSTSEQILPYEKRRQLNDEGFRVAIQGISMSPSLSRLLELDRIKSVESTGTMFDRTSSEQIRGIENPIHEKQYTVADMSRENFVNHFSFTFLPGRDCILQTYDERLPEVAIFSREGKNVSGRTYHDAQGLLEMSAIPYPDGSGVQFELQPRLEYGTAKRRLGLSHTSVSQASGMRECVDLKNDLKISLKLLPGQWLLLGASGERPTGVGRYFFTREEQSEQKLIIIRLSDVQRNYSAAMPQVDKLLEREESTIPESF